MLVAGVDQQNDAVTGIDRRADGMRDAVALTPERFHALHESAKVDNNGLVGNEGLEAC